MPSLHDHCSVTLQELVFVVTLCCIGPQTGGGLLASTVGGGGFDEVDVVGVGLVDDVGFVDGVGVVEASVPVPPSAPRI